MRKQIVLGIVAALSLSLVPTTVLAAPADKHSRNTYKSAVAVVDAWNENGYWELPEGECFTESALIALDERDGVASLYVQYASWDGCANSTIWWGEAQIDLTSAEYSFSDDSTEATLTRSVNACNGGDCRTVDIDLSWSVANPESYSNHNHYRDGSCVVNYKENQTYGSATVTGSLTVDEGNMLSVTPVRMAGVSQMFTSTVRVCR